jgi:hypothetical protein
MKDHQNLISAIDAEIAALEAQIAELKQKAAKQAWPWVPTWQAAGFSAISTGAIDETWWTGDRCDQGRFARFNFYRTREEAQARAELDLRLSIHAALRQLGGGDAGDWAIVFLNRNWVVLSNAGHSPGEARFTTEEQAQAALDALLAGGYLKHGEAK